MRDVRYGYEGENHVFAKAHGCDNDNWMAKDESNPYFTYDPSKCIVCTNAKRRIQRVRKVMTPKNGLEDWEVTLGFARALGYEMKYSHPSEIQIGKFFQSQGHGRAIPGVAEHIRKFWGPRMRAVILAHLNAGGAGLDPDVRAAVETLKAAVS